MHHSGRVKETYRLVSVADEGHYLVGVASGATRCSGMLVYCYDKFTQIRISSAPYNNVSPE